MKLKLTAIVLSATLILSMLSGCSKNDLVNNNHDEKVDTIGGSGAKGRYVETRFELPIGVVPLLVKENEDGSVDYYGTKGNRHKDLLLYNSKDLKTWEEQKISWIDALKNSKTGLTSVNAIEKKKDGSLLVAIEDSNRMTRIYKVTNAESTEIAMTSWDLADNSSEGVGGSFQMGNKEDAIIEGDPAQKVLKRAKVYIAQMITLENGDFIIRYYDGTIIRHDAKTGAEIKNYPQNYYDIAVLGNKIYWVNKEHDAIEVIDIETGSIDKKLSLAKNTKDVNLFAGNDDAIYIAGNSGISRMVSGGSVWETVIDGGLSSLSIPSLFLKNVAVGKDQSFYMIFMGDGQNVHICHCVFNPNVSSVPDTELSVYSLYENDTVRQAIGEFQQANPNIMINYKIGIDSDSSATVSDVIRALNVEILTNKAPDVLILDGLPANSYIEKGVFADLTDFYAEKNKINKLIEPVASTFKKDGKVYAIPARFKIPIMIGSGDLLAKIDSLEDMMSDYGSKKPLFTTGLIDEFLNAVIPSSYGAWIKQSGELDEAKLTVFLTAINNIYAKYQHKNNSSEMMISMDGGGGVINLSSADMEFIQGNVQSSISNVGSLTFFGTMLIKSFSADKSQVVNRSIKVLPGQAEGAYTPEVIAAVMQNSKQQDIAKEFLKTLLSDSIQKYDFGDGFSVNEKTFNDAAVMEYQEGGETKKKELTEMKVILSQLKTPVVPDNVVLEAVKNSATALLKGNKDVAGALKDILAKVEIYLAE